jgi:hypothetical protein
MACSLPSSLSLCQVGPALDLKLAVCHLVWCFCCCLQTDDYAVRADEALISWVAKQKLYSQGLLTPQAAAAVEALLQGRPVAPTAAPAAGAASGADAGESAARSTNAQPAGAADADTGLTLSERKNLVEVLRLVSTVVHPQG